MVTFQNLGPTRDGEDATGGLWAPLRCMQPGDLSKPGAGPHISVLRLVVHVLGQRLFISSKCMPLSP